jgi:hypothetical protein
MRVAVVTEEAAGPAVSAEERMQVSAAEDTRVSVAEAIRAELVMATVGPVSIMVVPVMARATTHPRSQRAVMEATAAMGRDTMHREARLDGRVILPAPDRRIERCRQGILVATTSHEINLLLHLRANPAFSNALARLQKVQPDPATLGLGRIQHTHTGSTHKQRNDCVTGRAKHLGGMMQNVIITITGVIVIIMITIGGIVIATLSFLSVEVFGDGMTDGGIRPGAMTHIIPTTITMVQSMGMKDFNRTRSLPMFRLRCSNWDITHTQLTGY